VSDLAELTIRMRHFTEVRDWGRFHDLKSLTLALVGEVGEVAELVQWLPAEDAVGTTEGSRLHARLGEELADVLLYLMRLADVAGVDLRAAAEVKLADSERRFPPEAHRGVAPLRD
jgi:dCTP diphosphatase